MKIEGRERKAMQKKKSNVRAPNTGEVVSVLALEGKEFLWAEERRGSHSQGRFVIGREKRRINKRDTNGRGQRKSCFPRT